jgi:outer membrane protein assembly factor BamA
VAAEGTIEQPVLSGGLRITEGEIPVTGQQRVTGIDLNLSYRDGLLAVERALAAFEGATLDLSGRIPSDLFRDRLPETARRFVARAGGPATLSAKIAGITPAVAAPFVAPGALDEIDAHLDGSIDLEADRAEIDRIRGSITLSRADVSLAGIAFTQQTMTRLGVHDGRVDVESWDWRQADNRITLQGGATIDDAPVLDLTARASLDASVLNALVPAARVGGRAEANIRFEGPAANPAINGRVTIQDGETRVTNPRLIVSNLTGAIVLAGDTLTLEQMTANVNGGDITITGSLRHRAFRPVDGTITLDGKDVSFDSSGLRAEADPNLTLTFEPRGPVLAGTVTVKRSSFRGVRSLTGGMFDFSRRRSTARRNADSPLGSLRLDVRVVTEEDLLVDIPQAQLSAAADVRVVGTVARPSLAGRITLPEGGLLFLGVNRLRLSEQGTIDFTNPNVIEPNLNLTAVTRVQGTEITLRLQGMPPDIQMPLTSDDPQLSQADLVSLLVSGRTAAEAADEGVVPGGELVVGLLAGQLLGAAGSVVGLETVRVERGTPDVRFDAGLVATETDPGARLTVGTNIGSRTEVVLSQSLEESGDLTWIVSYAALPPLRLRVVSQDDGQRLYGFQHEISSSSAQGSKRRADAEAPIVRDVIVTGAGSDEAEIRSRLEVKPGDRFSLFEWQDDRERLEDYYREQRRLEARVVTRRVPVPDDPSGLQLTYTITPGPRTTLVVEGFDPSKATRRAIDDAWAGVVVDDFLIEETTNLLRSELADDGFLLPTIAGTVERTGDEKRLHVRVDPGPRAGERRIEFTGNLQVPSGRLRTVLAEQSLDREIWLDPEPAREALVNFYRDSGYINATVKIGPISAAGRSAVRTVQVEEGALFHLSSIRLQGVNAVPAEDVTKAAALQPGAPFTEAEMERARVAIDSLYRTRGFNTVNVELTADPAPDHAEVVVVVTIDEGPQQLLREIVTTGLERARPQVVSQALRLDVGQPVDLAAWNAARQRLYETGVFRSVDIEREPIAVPAASAPAAAEGTTAEPVRAVITVQEWPFLRWRYGLDLEDNPPPTSDSSATVGVEASSGRTFGIGVASDLRARTLFGRTLSAGVAGRYSTDFEAIRFYTTTPLFFGRRITTNAFVERSREDIGTTSISDITSMTVEQRLRPVRRVELSYRYTFERESSIDQVTRAETPLPLDSTVATTGVLDFRNNLINTTTGWFHSSSLEYAPAAIGSELPFVKYLLQQRYYRTAGPIVFATSGRLGLATAFGEDLTASDRFVAGGGNSVRGYDQDQLSPFDAAGEPGGSALFVFNQEVRFPIFKWVRGVWFFDAGRAFPRVENLSFSDLSTSTGVGLRVHTPFILFRVDYGVPLDNRVTPTGSGWYFSIGQMF